MILAQLDLEMAAALASLVRDPELVDPAKPYLDPQPTQMVR